VLNRAAWILGFALRVGPQFGVALRSSFGSLLLELLVFKRTDEDARMRGAEDYTRAYSSSASAAYEADRGYLGVYLTSDLADPEII